MDCIIHVKKRKKQDADRNLCLPLPTGIVGILDAAGVVQVNKLPFLSADTAGRLSNIHWYKELPSDRSGSCSTVRVI